MENRQPVILAQGISKVFPGVKALDSVQLDLYPGEVLAVIGENGAGKSTLMNILIGKLRMDEGTIFLKGRPYAPKSSHEALQSGISMIHQELTLVPEMTVAENIWLGQEQQFQEYGFLSRRNMSEKARELLAELQIEIDSEAVVSDLSVAGMQLVEIARAVSCRSDVIIMDEPTSALTSVEIEKVYGIIRQLTKKGVGIIFITHKIDEMYAICDRACVLRDGKYIGACRMDQVTEKELIRMMVGRDVSNLYPKEAAPLGPVVLRVEHLEGRGRFRDINFEVRSGEILGFCGLMGAGRTEIAQAVFGVDGYDGGRIIMNGRTMIGQSVSNAIHNHLALVTEDRLRKGAIHNLSVRMNMSLSCLEALTRRGFVNRRLELEWCGKMVRSMDIKVSDLEQEIGSLSGGNQQKVIIGKWLLNNPDLLILDEPTRGIDVGAKTEIYKLICGLAKEGKAILLISSELPELMGMSDRILVVRHGAIVAERKRADFTQEDLMACAFGT